MCQQSFMHGGVRFQLSVQHSSKVRSIPLRHLFYTSPCFRIECHAASPMPKDASVRSIEIVASGLGPGGRSVYSWGTSYLSVRW